MSERANYVLQRSFDASRERVWSAWTESDLLSRWYGPNVETIIHELDVRPGGLWRVEMKWGENSNFQQAQYTEVSAPERLVSLHSVTDARWNIIANPMMPDWPRVLYSEVTLEEEGDDQTRMQLTWAPHDASEAEVACFTESIGGMGKGWEMGMDLLAKLLRDTPP